MLRKSNKPLIKKKHSNMSMINCTIVKHLY